MLNAGAGWEDISVLVPGEVVNLDLPTEHEWRTDIHLRASLDAIPVADGSFDAAVCLSVLEHVRDPDDAIREMHRVIRPGGLRILDMPFMQPEHMCPCDFQRYTRDGLARAAERAGFAVESITPQQNIYVTLYWICWEWLHARPRRPLHVFARPFLLWPLLWRAKRSSTRSPVLASAFQLVATKPPAGGK